MRSPPFMKVAVVAITSLTVIYCFFNAFFNADFVKTALKIPTPYSWSRIGVSCFGTIWNSIGLMKFFLYDCQSLRGVRQIFTCQISCHRITLINRIITCQRQVKFVKFPAFTSFRRAGVPFDEKLNHLKIAL